MSFYSEGDTGIAEGAISFLERYPIFAFFITFVVSLLIVSVVFFFTPSKEAQEELFSFNYGPVLVYKSIAFNNETHSEKILVSSLSGAKMLSLFVLVPKALAKSSVDVSIASNGRVSVLKSDPLYRIEALNKDSISLELSAATESKDVCSLLVVMHSDAVAGMTQQQLQSIIEAIVAKDVAGLDCNKANEIEKDLSERIYKAATGE